MKIERTKNAARNIFFDGIMRAMNMVIPFIMRTVMLHYLGMEYLGLNGLFKSILSFLNLAELGVGSAMVFSMYKPIAEDDEDTICALMKLYRTMYRVIGLVIAAAGLLLTPFLRNLINGDIPADMNLYILYFMNLGSTVLTYWMFAYKQALLDAHQRRDVVSKVAINVQFFEYVLKFLSLIVFRNYYLYLAVQLISQVLINVLTAMRVTKMYPKYSPKGTLPVGQVKEIVGRIRDLFTAKFSGVIFNSADTLVITSFMGLGPLAVYQNYYYVISSLRSFLEVIVGGCIAGVGNSLVTENEEKNYRDLEKFTMLFGWIMGVTTSMLLCLYQPFLQVWMGKENMLTFNYAVCFAVYYYTMGMNRFINMFKDAAGIWHKDRFRPLTAALANLGLNLATVRWLGLYGVLLSSVISIVIVQIPWLIANLFQEVFPRKYRNRYVQHFIELSAMTSISCLASMFICSKIHTGIWLLMLISVCISFLIPNALFFAVYGRNPMFKESVNQIRKIIAKRKSGI